MGSIVCKHTQRDEQGRVTDPKEGAGHCDYKVGQNEHNTATAEGNTVITGTVLWRQIQQHMYSMRTPHLAIKHQGFV